MSGRIRYGGFDGGSEIIVDQVNSFLDKALELAVSSLGPVQVQVDPGDLQVRAGQPATSILIFEIPIRWREVE